MRQEVENPFGVLRPRAQLRRRIAKGAAAVVMTIALTLPGVAMANPASGATVTLTQPDGATFESTISGDEYFNYRLMDNGAIVELDPSDGVYKQVVRGSDGSVAFGSPAQAERDSGAIGKSDLSDEATRKAIYALMGSEYRESTTSNPSSPVTADKITAKQRKDVNEREGAEKTLPLLTVIVEFNDEKYRDDYNWGDQFFTGEWSIEKYYNIASNGKFTWRPIEETSATGVDGNHNPYDTANDGVVHVTLDRDHGKLDYGQNYIETLEATFDAVSKYVDLAKYDTNHDGKLDKTEIGIGLVFAGYDQSAGYVPSGHGCIWPHQWTFSDAASQNGMDAKPYEVTTTSGKVGIDSYVTQAETESTGASEEHQSGIGALGHELGHYIGLPDLYDTSDGSDPGPWADYSFSGLSMMDGGSWGVVQTGKDAGIYRPGFFDAWSRYFLGYIEPEEITHDGVYTASSQMSEAGFKSFIVRASDGEYYMIENRQYESFDQGMERFYLKGKMSGYSYDNPTGGIVVYHIDQGIVDEDGILTGDNTVNVSTHRPGAMPAYFELADFNGGKPLIRMPFLNSHTQDQLGTSTTPVLLYNGKDTPAERTDTGIKISSTAKGAASQAFVVDFPASLASLDGKAELSADGGSVKYTAKLNNLNVDQKAELVVLDADGNKVDADWAHAWLAGGAADENAVSTLSASIDVPANETTKAQGYQVAVFLDGKQLGEAVKLTVAAHPVTLTSIKPAESTLDSNGADVSFSADLKYVPEGKSTQLRVYDASGSAIDRAWATVDLHKGEDGGYAASISFPGNLEKADARYEVAVLVDGQEVNPNARATVTVKAVPKVEVGTMFRMYNPNSGEHFYTQSKLEAGSLVKAGWTYEGVAWKAPKTSNTPVYRLYNPNAGDHHYTTNADERDMLVNAGWNDEGIGWYSDDEQGVPVYRQYNPNAKAGAHNFTTSKAENDHLVKVGWNAEGIAWYGVK